MSKEASSHHPVRVACAAGGPGPLTGSARLRHLLASRGAALVATMALTSVAALLATWPLGRHLATATLGSGEALLTAWQLNWFQHALLTDPLAWVDANIFFPYQNAATLNDLLLTHALVTLPVAGFESPVLALNLALLGGIVLCGVFAHLLILELVGEPWVASVGGVLFALTPFRFLHISHLSIAAAWAIPLFFWALLRHLRQPSWGRAAFASASGVAVGLSSLYHAAYVAPIIPLIVLFGLRRGPGGRAVWLPLLAAGVSGLALLGCFLVPYASALASFGVASAPSDLGRYGADLTSLGQKPAFFGEAAGDTGIDAEARLYPGMALALLALAGALSAAASAKIRPGWRRGVLAALLILTAIAGVGLLLPPAGLLKDAWALVVLALIWVGPPLSMLWAIRETNALHPAGPAVAIRLGIAGAGLSFVLALGPQARYASEALGPAPYWLLTQVTAAFEGARAPARFGGLVVLFLALVAAGALAHLGRGRTARSRLAVAVVACGALAACLGELPLPDLPEGRPLATQPDLRDPAYAWIAAQPGRFGILELPDWRSASEPHYEQRSYRALRYMLASKQHGQHLVNGTGRIRPFLWRRFRRLETWSDEFFAFITAYFPVRYVLVHEEGLPPLSRDAVWARLDRGTDGWDEVLRTPGSRVYTIDRSSGRGTFVDRLYLRRDVGPRVRVTFSARLAPDPAPRPEVEERARTSRTLELLRSGEPVKTWSIDAGWQQLQATVLVDVTAPAANAGWPDTAVLFRWKLGREEEPGFEIRSLSVEAKAILPRPGSPGP